MEIVIRPVRPGDGKGINELRRMPGVFENILGIPSEREARNEAGIAALDHATQHHFAAVTYNEQGEEIMIGYGSLTVASNPRRRHCGDIGLMVHRDYQGRGVGTKLMEALIDMADNWLMLVRLELDVFADNARAIALYKKFGFVEEGLKRAEAIRNGEYVDSLLMARIRLPKDR